MWADLEIIHIVVSLLAMSHDHERAPLADVI
jgi:hypothetical protein